MLFSRALDRGLRRVHLWELVVVHGEVACMCFVVDCKLCFGDIVVVGRHTAEKGIVGEELAGLDIGMEVFVLAEELEVDNFGRKLVENIDWV